MSLSVDWGLLGLLHIIVVETMFRRLEDSFRTIMLSDLELVSIIAVVSNFMRFHNVSKRQDVGNSIRTVPHLTISRNCTSEFCYRFDGLGVNGKTTSHLMDIS